jgi:hypothetical protein
VDEVMRDTVVAVFGASVGLAGLLLVFVGFIYARGESFTDVRRRDSYRRVARIGVVPFLASLACAWMCIDALVRDPGLANVAVATFRVTLIGAGLYGTLTIVAFL